MIRTKINRPKPNRNRHGSKINEDVEANILTVFHEFERNMEDKRKMTQTEQK